MLNIGELTGDHPAITLNGHALEEVDFFSYLGSEVEQTARVHGERCWNQTGEGSNCLSIECGDGRCSGVKTSVRQPMCRQKRLQWFRHLQRIPDHRPQKQLLRCKLRGKNRRPCGTSLQWVDLISRDLTRIANWQEVVMERSEWRAAIHQPNSTAQSPSVTK